MLKRFWPIPAIGSCIRALLLHVVGFIGLLTVVGDNPAFWSLGLLAYTLGLRHAFNADNLGLLDAVRKLIQQKRNPLDVRFLFSLGHSSVVFLMVLAIALSFHWIQDKMPQLQEIGGTIGITVSGSFFILIGIINLIILYNLCRILRKLRQGIQPTRRCRRNSG